MKKLMIMAIAATAALAAPAAASAQDLDGQFIDVAARALEGTGFVITVPPTPGFDVFTNDGGQVLDSKVRARLADGTTGQVDRLEWKAQELRVQDPNDPQAAIDAPDGTLLDTAIYSLTTVNTILAADPPTIVLSTGLSVPALVGFVEDGAGNLEQAEVQDQQAEAKFRPEQDGTVIPDLDPAACNLVVLIHDFDGTISAASTLDGQDAC